MRYIQNKLLLLLPALLVSSCASLLNEPLTKIKVQTTAPSSITINGQTKATILNEAGFTINRENSLLEVTSQTGDITKTVYVKPVSSAAYYLNILCSYGLGMLVDKNSSLRYGYPKRIYLNSTDSAARYYRFSQDDHRGKLLLHLSLPHVNNFHLKPEGEVGYKSNTGFWGLSTGLDYFHARRTFVQLYASAVSDFFVPVPAAVDMEGAYEKMSSVYLAFSNNHQLKRFSLGYGVAFCENSWDYRFLSKAAIDDAPRDAVKKRSKALGLVFPAYYQTGEHFKIGLLYRPTLFRFNAHPAFVYEHLISLDLAWKITLKR